MTDRPLPSPPDRTLPRWAALFAELTAGAAWPLAFWAGVNSGATYVPGAERAALSWACGVAVAAIVLVGASWAFLPWRARLHGLGAVGLAVVAGVYAANRLAG